MGVPIAELISRIACGRDRGAFDRLYDELSGRVYGFLLRLLRNRPDADDVLQETFLQVWNQAGRFDPERANVDGWVLMIARSRAADRLRKRAAAPTADLTADPVATADPSEPLARADDATRVSNALGQLPHEQRELIRMAFFDGLTHEQIARAMNIPLGTVKTRIRLGLIRLRDRFADSRAEAAPA
jgi:RNA polymerase sigma-70 factor (ECF subfamily)